MTARAAITAAAMREAIAAAKQGLRVQITRGDTTITLEPEGTPPQPVDPFDGWKAKRDARHA